MKKFRVAIHHRGYQFETPLVFEVYAKNKTDAKWDVIMRYGDQYVAKVTEIKD